MGLGPGGVDELEVNVRSSDVAAPFTVSDPLAGLTLKPETAPTAYGYVPFSSVNESVLESEVFGVPFSVTVQPTPAVNPDSVKVTG